MMRIKKLLTFFMVTALIAQTVFVLPMATVSAGAVDPVRIIFDSDMSSDHDDVSDLAVLNGLADLGECQIIACMASSTNGATALCMNAINTYYGRSDVPCGRRPDIGGGAMYPATIANEYPHPLYSTYQDPPLAVNLYRQVLAAQPDHSVTIVTVGYLNNLEALMKSGPDQYSSLSGMDLIRQKVKLFGCSGGAYPEGDEFNLRLEPTAASYVINNWPVQMLCDGFDIGSAIHSGQDLMKTRTDNPIRRVWEIKGYNSGYYPTWGQIMIYNVVRQEECKTLYNFVNVGYNSCDATGHNKWLTDKDPTGDQDQAYVQEIQRYPIQDSINTLLMDSGAPRSKGTTLPPNKPGNFRATVVGNDTINLQWTDNSWNETGFTIERKINGDFTPIATVGEGVTTYSDTGLSSTANVCYRIKAINSIGGSEYLAKTVFSGWTEYNLDKPSDTAPLYNYYQYDNLNWSGKPPVAHRVINNDSNHGQDLVINLLVGARGHYGNYYVYFFYQDANNWYRLSAGTSGLGLPSKFEKCVNGTISQIGALGEGVNIGNGTVMQKWQITVSHTGQLTFFDNSNNTINDSGRPYNSMHQVLNVSDSLSFTNGKIGLGGDISQPVWDDFNFETGDIHVTGVSIDLTSALMNIGGTKQLTANVVPINATNNAVNWSSTNPSVATVDSTTGLVTGVSDGNATITATTLEGGVTAICQVTVSASYVPVTGISMDPTFATVNVGTTKQLTANVAPANAYNKNVSWSSSNEGVATVNSSGLVTAIAAGNTTITATTQEGGKTASCDITVPTVPVTGVSLDVSSTSVSIQGTRMLTATVVPANASNKTVSWSSGDEGIAKVNSAGVVTGVAEGNATITATTQDGGKIATCQVTVTPLVELEGVSVATYAELKAALNATVTGESADNPTVIIVKNNITLTGTLDMVGSGKFKTLVADGNCTLSRGSGCTGFMIQLLGGATLNLGKTNYSGTLTFDGALSGVATDATFYINEGSTFNMYSGKITNHNGNGIAAIRVNGPSTGPKTKVNLYGGTISNNTGGFAFGAIHLRQFSDLLIDGATIIGNTCSGEGSAIRAQNGCSVVLKSGLIKGNGGNNSILILSDDPTHPATFEMHGGTIEGIGDTYSDSSNLIAIGSPSYPNQPSTAVFYGGTIKNTAYTAIQVGGSGGSATFTSENGGNGLVMQNCGYDGNRITAVDAGCIKVVNNSTVNVLAGTFKDSRASSNGGFASILSGTLNLSGGVVSGCDIAIRQSGGTLNMSGSAKLSSTDSIVLGSGKTVTVTGTLATEGAVAAFAGVTNGQQVLSGDSGLVAANAGKFAAVTSSKTCGVGSDGKVNESIVAPEFIENPPEAIITLGFTGTSATVNSNVAIPSAKLIVSSYDTNGVLVDIKIFPVAVEANVQLEKALTDFNAGAKVKVMLWDSLDKNKPLTDVFVQ